MSNWSRLVNVFRGDRLSREIEEELRSHIDEAIQEGRDPAEARLAFGPMARIQEDTRDLSLIAWLDSLRADAVFGWRQIRKNRVTSAAAILSLALAIGACTAAFRLIDALLLRPLPVAAPEQLYFLSQQGIGPEGTPQNFDGFAYPAFRQMQAAVKGDAELIAISYTDRTDLTYGSSQEMEKAYLQYVSGEMFRSFGLRPALGRLLMESDDRTPGAHPYAVLSQDYWTRRFGGDSKVVGRTFRMDKRVYEVIGVVDGPFTGTDTGTVVDIFVPTMMHPRVTRSDSTWHRTLVRLAPGVPIESVRARLGASFRSFEEDRAKGFTNMSRQAIERFLDQTLLMQPAVAGVSGLQSEYRRALVALGILVLLVLLIACANVANLMTAQASARAREMALRVAIGAGRWRLMQLVMVESAWIAFLAAALGALFAWWSAPFVVGMVNPPDNPARLILPADWRVLGFGLALTLFVTFLFGLAPALRASAVQPVSALKGGDSPRARSRLMHTLIAAQVAFCCLVLFVAGLFVATFERLSNRPNGFSDERLLTLETLAEHEQPTPVWDQVADHLRAVAGVERVALAAWPLMSGEGWNNPISIGGGPPSEDLAYFLSVSPGWVGEMRIPFIDGRDFRTSDTYPGMAIVNETFAKRFFAGENPIGKSFFAEGDGGDRHPFQVVGLVRDARYRRLREPIPPVVYVPFHAVDATGALLAVSGGTFIVRTSIANPLALVTTLRKEVSRAAPGFRVSRTRTQTEINQLGTVRERLLARLALFFAGVALLLASVGLYGVLDYSVLQRRREIGIRMAIGASAGDIARRVTADIFAMVLLGAVAGLALGLVSVRFVESLLFEVKATDLPMLALPLTTILVAALLAALPAVIHALRLDPARMLRAE